MMAAMSRKVFDAHFKGVVVEHVPDDLHPGNRYIRVRPVWKGVDRPNVGGWGLLLRHEKLALRLKAAIEAGAVYGKVERLTDVNGKSYINTQLRLRILSRHMNADLKRLGF
jgi:hypothetical protein